MSSSELIRTFLTDRLGVQPEQIQPGAALAELGVDSLMLAELMFEAEDRFGVEMPPDLKPPRTVGDMQAIIDSLATVKTG